MVRKLFSLIKLSFLVFFLKFFASGKSKVGIIYIGKKPKRNPTITIAGAARD